MGTFSRNPLVVAAAKANLELLQDIGCEELREKGERLTAGFRELITDARHDVFIPDNTGFFYNHFTNGESNPCRG